MSDSSRHRAKLMMTHAFHHVEKGHKKNKFRRFVKNTAKNAFRNMSKTQMVGTGIALTGAVAGLIAASVLTAGIAPAVLSGIAAGTYVIKKMVTEISFEVNRLNRNWLANYKKAYNFQAKAYADTLSLEGRDALRRAIDHYNITRNILQNEIKPLAALDFTTCNDAINAAQATCRFIHHADKTRNYLLPCLDLCIFLLLQYKELSNAWNRNSKQIEGALISWLEHHEEVLIGHCHEDSSEICYGPVSRSQMTTPRNPHKSGKGLGVQSTGQDGDVILSHDEGLDLMKLINLLAENSVTHVEKVMRQSREKIPATYNYQAMMRELTSDLSAVNGAQARHRMLIEDCFELADKPKLLPKVGRKISHAVTRRTKGEIALSIFEEAVDLSSIATPFIPDLPIGKVLGATIKGGTLIRAGITGVTTLADILGGIAIAKSNDGPAIQSGLLDFKMRQEASEADLKSSGIKVQDLITRAGTHFHYAVDACKELEKAGGSTISSCRDAWDYCKVVAEVVHEMDKMEKYLIASLSLVVHLTEQTMKWAEDEVDLWKSVEGAIGEFVADTTAHNVCREANSHCYGPKLTKKVRGGTFTNRLHGRYDNELDYSKPHKPL